MPELPEVQTTVDGLNHKVKNLQIVDVWTSYDSPYHYGKGNIKDPAHFAEFKKSIVGSKIKSAERQGKNVLIHLSNNRTILTHMKMTGHFMYGEYQPVVTAKKITGWQPVEQKGPLADPFNKHVRLLFTLSNGKHLAFADTRKFAKVFVFEDKNREKIEDLAKLGPDPLEKKFSVKLMTERLFIRKNWKIKQALMEQELIAGIGNIYSDEMLWLSGIHPLSIVSKIPAPQLKKLHTAMIDVLKKGLDFGGDSTSDYRNIFGEPGKFQHRHNVYRRKGELCPKKDGGKIVRIIVGARSTHYCPVHQTLYD